MAIPLRILNRLRYGKPVAAEIPAPASSHRAFIMVLPLVPSLHKNPEAWINGDRQGVAFASTPVLRDPESITGYEIRYLAHDAKYTDEEWGNDYVLDDVTTRARRVFVTREEEIEAALSPWLSDMSQLCPPQSFNSSLVHSRIDGYLNRPEECPHLWE